MPYKNPEDLARRKESVKQSGQAFMRAYKEANPCTDCGKYFKHYQMDMDHLDNKKYDITSMYMFSPTAPKFLEEMSKCELVCKNCHGTRTWMRLIEKGGGLDGSELIG